MVTFIFISRILGYKLLISTQIIYNGALFIYWYYVILRE